MKMKGLKTRINTIWINFKSFSFLLRFLSVLALLLITISILSFIFIFYNAAQLECDFSSKGFNFLLSYFDFPIKSFAAFLLVLTISVTVYRIKQTDALIKTSQDQNRIANYFKFREEFVNHFKPSVISKLVQKKMTYEELYYPLFFAVYGNTSTFDGKYKDSFVIGLNNFSLFLNECAINKSLAINISDWVEDYYHEFILSSQATLNIGIQPVIYAIVNEFLQVLKNQDFHFKSKDEEVFFMRFTEAYIMYLFCQDLKTFAGTEKRVGGFLPTNYYSFSKSINIDLYKYLSS